MNKKSSLVVLAATLGLFSLAGCTARYQDMLRDREATIRDLEGKVHAARTQNAALTRSNESLLKELSSANSKVQPVEASARGGDTLDGLKKDLEADGANQDKISVRYRKGRVSIGISDRVTFAPGSTRIAPEGKSLLQRISAALRKRYPGKRIYVEGHTDTDPIRKSKKRFRNNRHLSSERADAVASYLIGKCKIDESRVVIVGYGPTDPISKDKARNRRVEIVVAE
ncbi:MAG: flagellar motor protein MotB [Planctomycetota bacterium]